jgi:leucyl aminopeptidase/ATP-dependent Zn protease
MMLMIITTVSCEPALSHKAQCVAFFAQDLASATAYEALKSFPEVAAVLEQKEFKGSVGSVVTVPVMSDNTLVYVVIAGTGSRTVTQARLVEQYRRALGAVVKAAVANKCATVALTLPDATRFNLSVADLVEQTVSTAFIAAYHFDDFITDEDRKESKELNLTIVVESSDQAEAKTGVVRGEIIGKAVNKARYWVDLPPTVLTPPELADKARKIAHDNGLKITVFNEEQINEMGMGGLAAVSRGSELECRLAILEYSCGKTDVPTLGFVGKGITFDSGGLSIKPANSMETMKEDMAGAAAVIAAMEAIAILKPDINIVAITPLAENLPSGNAVKGDYYKSKNYLYKKTVELHNNLKGGVFKNKTIKTSFEDYFKKPTCTFEDIIGAENAKRIFSDVIDYLISPEKFDLAKITPEKGYLLTGPARTGKTYIAEAFAGEVRKRMTALGKNPDNVHFLSATHDEINRLGGIKDLLAIAKFYAPCILFIDEIDLLGLQRGGTNSMLADFLVGLSDFSHQDSDKQVIVIAATNRSENLDDALKRRGRLGVEIRFTYPSADYRKDFFVHKLESIGIATDTIDIDSLVRQTVGKSFNDLDSILKKALHNAKNLVLPLDQMLLEQAIDSEIFLILPENDHPLSETERQLIAASIAGEALINYVLDTGALVVRATINPYLPILQEKSALAGIFKEEKEDTTPKKQQALIKYGKVFVVSDFEFLNEHCTSEQIKNTCKQLLAGRCAQQILLGVISHNKEAKDNMQKCYALAKELVGKSIELSLLSDKMRDSFADEAFDLVTTMEQEVTTLLTEHKDKLEQLATALLKLNTLNSDTIAYIVDGQLAADIAKEKEKEKAQDTTTIIEHPAVA